METTDNLNSRRLPGLPGMAKTQIRTITVPSVEAIASDSVKVEKVELSDEYTRIDLIHYADPMYISGGWVQIYPETYIQPNGTPVKLKLLNVINIPIAPTKHYYKHGNDRVAFSLFFPPVPKGVEYIDLIERLNGGDSFFNVYGIRMREINEGPIRLDKFSLN